MRVDKRYMGLDEVSRAVAWKVDARNKPSINDDDHWLLRLICTGAACFFIALALCLLFGAAISPFWT